MPGGNRVFANGYLSSGGGVNIRGGWGGGGNLGNASVTFFFEMTLITDHKKDMVESL